MQSSVKRGLALVLCAGLATSLMTGCGKKNDDAAAVAVKVNDQTVDADVANFIVRYEQAKFESNMGGLFQAFGYTDYWLSDMYGTGRPYYMDFKDAQVEKIEEMLLASENAEAAGVSLTDEQKSAISEAASSFIAQNDPETLERMHATQETVEAALTLYAVQGLVEDVWGQDIDTEVSDEEAAQRRVSYTSFIAVAPQEEEEAVTEGADAAQEEISEAAEAASEAAVEAASEAAVEAESDALTGSAAETEAEEGGESALENAEAASEEAATEDETEGETEDPAMAEARALARSRAEAFLADAAGIADGEAFRAAGQEVKGDDTSVQVSSYTFGSQSTYPDAAIIEATEGLDDNTLVDHVVQVGDSFYVLFVEDAFDEEATEDQRQTILSQRRTQAISDKYDSLKTDADIAADAEIFDNIVFDYFLTSQAPEDEAVSEAEEALSEAEEALSEAAEEVTEGAESEGVAE